MSSRAGAAKPRKLAGSGASGETEGTHWRRNVAVTVAVALLGLLGGLAGSLIGVYTGARQIDAQRDQFQAQIEEDRRATLRQDRREAYTHWLAATNALLQSIERVQDAFVGPVDQFDVAGYQALVNQVEADYANLQDGGAEVAMVGNSDLIDPIGKLYAQVYLLLVPLREPIFVLNDPGEVLSDRDILLIRDKVSSFQREIYDIAGGLLAGMRKDLGADEGEDQSGALLS